MVVIDGYGGYVPLYRIQRDDIASQYGGSGRGENAVPGRDENHVTMASEAASLAVERSGIDAEELDAVYTASVTDYFAEHGIGAPLAYRLGATGDVATGDFQSSTRAASDALLSAKDFVSANGGSALVVGTDIVPAEPDSEDEETAGAGAGAIVLRDGSDEPAARITDVGRETTGFVERHRRHGEPAEPGDGRFERRHGVTPATEGAVDSLEGADSPSLAVVYAPGRRLARTAAGAVSDAERISTFNDVGNAGTASFFIDLVDLLEGADAGQSGVAIAYGQGGADAVAFETADGVGAAAGLSVDEQLESKEYVTYAKNQEYRARIDYEGA